MRSVINSYITPRLCSRCIGIFFIAASQNFLVEWRHNAESNGQSVQLAVLVNSIAI